MNRPPDAPNPPVNPGRRELLRHRRGVLDLDGRPLAVRLIVDGRDGSLLLPVPREAGAAEDFVLRVPDDGFDAMALLLDVEPHDDEFDEARDRWAAYHGTSDRPVWLRARVDSAKWNRRVWPGEEIAHANPLHDAEPALCKRFNTHPGRLPDVVEHLTTARPASPVVVGVDDYGFDVRASIGVIRCEWHRPARDAADAEAMTDALLAPPAP